MRTDILLRVSDLSCMRHQARVFSHISFELAAGEMLLVEGPNGSGKSSLLRLLTGLASPFSGEICWRNHSIQDLRDEYWHDLHYIGHLNGLKTGLTVAENLYLAEQLLYCPSNFSDEVLLQLQLSTLVNTPVKYLSAGQKRRVSLAKLFLFPKKLWILDEPLTSLDTNTQNSLLLHLENHLHQGGLAIISSHQVLPLTHITPQILRFAC